MATQTPIDWSAIREEIHCPLCGYNLRGLSEPRCPECGYQFHWPDLLDPDRRKHPYLFEHHPERNLRSFFSTLFHGLIALTFWRNLRPSQPYAPRRLALYAVLVALMGLVASVIVSIPLLQIQASEMTARRQSYSLWAKSDPQFAQSVVQQYGSLQAYLDVEAPLPWSWRFFTLALPRVNLLGPPVAAWLVPGLLFPVLLIFRDTMDRSGVKTLHVLRCIIYSADILFTLSLACILAAAYDLYTGATWWSSGYPSIGQCLLGGGFHNTLPTASAALLHWMPAIALPFITWRLILAYRRYLRFPAPASTILLAMIPPILAFVILLTWKLI